MHHKKSMPPDPPSMPIPVAGMSVRLAPAVRVCDDGRLLVSTRSGTAVRLRPAVDRVLGGEHGRPSARSFEVTDPTRWVLATALLRRDLAEPLWSPPGADLTEVAVVIPVRDRAASLARLLDALPAVAEVIVVDDGSADPDLLSRTAQARGARVLRRGTAAGPAAARNLGLRAVRSPFVAFLDSDVVPDPQALGRLRRHLDDPGLAIAGARVLALRDARSQASCGSADSRDGRRTAGWVARYEEARSALDLGPDPGRVAPGSRLSYVPSAAIMARVAALGDGFDESMPVAEDVDLVWRVVDRGWGVRYCPEAIVRHDHRVRVVAWLARRRDYGTGAALLARRHGTRVAPARFTPTAGLLGLGLVVGGRRGALLAAGSMATEWVGFAGGSQRTPGLATRLMLASAAATCGQLGGLITRHHWPIFAAAMLVSPRARRLVALAGCAEGVLDYARVRPRQGVPSYLLAHRLDDAAYGWGVWLGAWRARSATALLPALLPPLLPDGSRTSVRRTPPTEPHRRLRRWPRRPDSVGRPAVGDR